MVRGTELIFVEGALQMFVVSKDDLALLFADFTPLFGSKPSL
jgi:hypothetical protein